MARIYVSTSNTPRLVEVSESIEQVVELMNDANRLVKINPRATGIPEYHNKESVLFVTADPDPDHFDQPENTGDVQAPDLVYTPSPARVGTEEPKPYRSVGDVEAEKETARREEAAKAKSAK